MNFSQIYNTFAIVLVFVLAICATQIEAKGKGKGRGGGNSGHAWRAGAHVAGSAVQGVAAEAVRQAG